MSISAMVGTALGLILIFALLALFCSGITESISNALQMRAKYLLTALHGMLDTPESSATAPSKEAKRQLSQQTTDGAATEAAAQAMRATVASAASDTPTEKVQTPGNLNLTLALFGHPLIKSQQTRKTWFARRDGAVRNPHYISSQVFTQALVDTLLPHTDPADPAASRSVLVRLQAALSTPPLKGLPCSAALLALASQAEGSLEQFEASVEHWYDEQMKQISGWYKRWSKVVLGVVGFVVAVVVNIDAAQLTHQLYVNEPVRQAVVAASESGALCQNLATAKERADCASDQIAKLDDAGLPIWYPAHCALGPHMARCWAWSADAPPHLWDLPLKLLGWLLTAFAVSFGAPFWFDALSRLGSLRNTGPKPA